MALVSTDVVSEETLRFNFRLPSVEDSASEHALSGELIEALEAGVDFVEHLIGVPLLDRPGYIEVCPRQKNWPLIFTLPRVTRLTEIKHWSTYDGYVSPVSEPNVTIGSANLGRFRSTRNVVWVWPPNGEWPSQTIGHQVQVHLVRGFATIPSGLKNAVIAAARQRFNGVDEIKPTNAIYAWVDPYVSMRTDYQDFFETEGATPPAVTGFTDYLGGTSADTTFTESEAILGLSSSGALDLPSSITGSGYVGLFVPIGREYPTVVHFGMSPVNSRSAWTEVDIDFTTAAGVHYNRLLHSANLNLDAASGETYHFTL